MLIKKWNSIIQKCNPNILWTIKSWLVALMVLSVLVALPQGVLIYQRNADAINSQNFSSDNSEDPSNEESQVLNSPIQKDTTKETPKETMESTEEQELQTQSESISNAGDENFSDIHEIYAITSDDVEKSTFNIEFSGYNIGLNKKFNVTVHYGFLDSNGVYHNDSLPSNKKEDVKREITAGNSKKDNNPNYLCSFFDFSNHNENIIYNNINYSYVSSCFNGAPNESSAQALTKLACLTSKNNGSDTYKWAYTNELSWWNRDQLGDNIDANGDIDVYMVYKVNDGMSNITYSYSNNKEIKKVHWCKEDNDGTMENLQAAWTPDFPRRAIGATSSTASGIIIFSLYRYVTKPIVSDYKDYIFKTIKIGSTTGIQRIKCYYDTNANKFMWYYTKETSADSGWTEFDVADIYVVYEEYEAKTIDSISKNIKINLYDYDAWARSSWDSDNNKYNLGNFDGGISSISDLKFQGEQKVRYEWNIWNGSKDKRASTEIYSHTLNSSGFPNLLKQGSDSYHVNRTDLSYLFTNNPNEEAKYYKTNYENINSLFSEQKFQETGFFEYDSAVASAKLDKANKKFALMEPESYSKTDGIPKFMPFNDHGYTKEKSTTDNRNYLFGMTIDMNFMQPTNGTKTWKEKTSDMVYKFSGDDDLLVYVDDVLCLDTGGIHAAIDGCINFRTGKVYRAQKWPDSESDDQLVTYDEEGHKGIELSLYDLFNNEGKVNPDEWVDVELPGNKTSKRFADQTVHTMKIIYFERGEGDSNCQIKFNLEPVPSFQIGKYVGQENVDIVNASASFNYLVGVWDSTKGEAGEYVPYQGSYDVYTGSVGKWDIHVKQDTTTDGKINLRNDQVAFINNLNAGAKLLVAESDVDLTSPTDIWNVTANNKDVSKFDKIEVDNKEWWGVSEIEIKDITGEGFANRYDEEAVYDLKIKKEDYGEDPQTPIDIYINNKIYLGKYSVIDASGKETYYTTNPNDPDTSLTYRDTTLTTKETLVVHRIGAGTPVGVDTKDERVLSKEEALTYPEDLQLRIVDSKLTDNKFEGNIIRAKTSNADDRYSQIVLRIGNYIPPSGLINDITPYIYLLFAILCLIEVALLTAYSIKKRRKV